MTDKNVVDVDLFEAQDEADPINESAMAFFLSKACQPGDHGLSFADMMRFSEELVSLSLAFAGADHEDLFERNLKVALEYIGMRTRYLRLKWFMKLRAEKAR